MCDTLSYSLTTQQSMALLSEKDIPFELIEVCSYVSYPNTFMHQCSDVLTNSCVQLMSHFVTNSIIFMH